MKNIAVTLFLVLGCLGCGSGVNLYSGTLQIGPPEKITRPGLNNPRIEIVNGTSSDMDVVCFCASVSRGEETPDNDKMRERLSRAPDFQRIEARAPKHSRIIIRFAFFNDPSNLDKRPVCVIMYRRAKPPTEN